jgi:hypothetical protein
VKRWKCFELEGGKERAKWSNYKNHLLFYHEENKILSSLQCVCVCIYSWSSSFLERDKL